MGCQCAPCHNNRRKSRVINMHLPSKRRCWGVYTSQQVVFLYFRTAFTGTPVRSDIFLGVSFFPFTCLTASHSAYRSLSFLFRILIILPWTISYMLSSGISATFYFLSTLQARLYPSTSSLTYCLRSSVNNCIKWNRFVIWVICGDASSILFWKHKPPSWVLLFTCGYCRNQAHTSSELWELRTATGRDVLWSTSMEA